MPRPLSSYAPPTSLVVERADGALILLASALDASHLPETCGRVIERGRVVVDRLNLRPIVIAQIMVRGHVVLLDTDRVAVTLDLKRQARNAASRGYRKASKERRRAA